MKPFDKAFVKAYAQHDRKPLADCLQEAMVDMKDDDKNLIRIARPTQEASSRHHSSCEVQSREVRPRGHDVIGIQTDLMSEPSSDVALPLSGIKAVNTSITPIIHATSDINDSIMSAPLSLFRPGGSENVSAHEKKSTTSDKAADASENVTLPFSRQESERESPIETGHATPEPVLPLVTVQETVTTVDWREVSSLSTDRSSSSVEVHTDSHESIAATAEAVDTPARSGSGAKQFQEAAQEDGDAIKPMSMKALKQSGQAKLMKHLDTTVLASAVEANLPRPKEDKIDHEDRLRQEAEKQTRSQSVQNVLEAADVIRVPAFVSKVKPEEKKLPPTPEQLFEQWANGMQMSWKESTVSPSGRAATELETPTASQLPNTPAAGTLSSFEEETVRDVDTSGTEMQSEPDSVNKIEQEKETSDEMLEENVDDGNATELLNADTSDCITSDCNTTTETAQEVESADAQSDQHDFADTNESVNSRETGMGVDEKAGHENVVINQEDDVEAASSEDSSTTTSYQSMVDVESFTWNPGSLKLAREASAQVDALASTLIASRHQGRRIVGMTACSSGDGCTTLLLSAAKRLCEFGMNVAMVDANVQHPALAKSLGITSQHGWDDVLLGQAQLPQAIVRSEHDHASVLPFSGYHQNNPHGDEIKKHFAEHLRALGDQHDLVLVDMGRFNDLSDDANCWQAVARSAIDCILIIHNVRSAGEVELARVRESIRLAGLVEAGVAQNFVA